MQNFISLHFYIMLKIVTMNFRIGKEILLYDCTKEIVLSMHNKGGRSGILLIVLKKYTLFIIFILYKMECSIITFI